MKSILTLIFTLLCFTVSSNVNNDKDQLFIEREGNIIHVIGFKEGDKIKLFDHRSGEHILSKTIGEIDLSQLPVGEYLIENNRGDSVVVEKKRLQLVVEHFLDARYMVSKDSEYKKHSKLTSVEDLENYQIKREGRLLQIEKESDDVTIVDFKEGDEIKLFELKDKIHVLSKTYNHIDFSQLPKGAYILENNRGQSVVIEKS